MTEVGYSALDPKALTLWRRESILITALPVGMLMLGLTIAAVLDDGPTVAVAAAGALLAGVVGGLAWWLPSRVYARWSYRLDDVALEVRHGAFIERRSVIPYFRVQHVDSASGPFERRLGLVQLKVHTASSGTDAKIPGLGEDVATELRRHIVERAGLSDGV